jgi:hypothetical protein
MPSLFIWDGPGVSHRRTPRVHLPPPQPTSTARRRISTSEGDFLVDADGNVIEQVADSFSPVHEYVSSPPEERAECAEEAEDGPDNR